MAKIKRVRGTYAVGAGEVTLRIVVGEGQFGTSLVRLDTVDLASGTVAMVRIGAAPEIVGKQIAVSTTVTDVQRFTNRTAVQYVLSGGPEQSEFRASGEVDEEGGSIHYVARFDLVP